MMTLSKLDKADADLVTLECEDFDEEHFKRRKLKQGVQALQVQSSFPVMPVVSCSNSQTGTFECARRSHSAVCNLTSVCCERALPPVNASFL